MNMKKILLFTVISIIALSLLGSVSAGLFGFGVNEVGGVKFNLDAFDEANKDDTNLEPELCVEGAKNVDSKLFEDGHGRELLINVYESPDGSFDLDNLKLVNLSSKSKISKDTFGGKDCIVLIYKNKQYKDIGYVEDGKLVVLTERTGFYDTYRYENRTEITIDEIIDAK